MYLLWFLIIGLVAGWLAGRIMRSGNHGLAGDLVIEILGALLGGFLFDLVGLSASSMIGSLITATVGAAVLIALLRRLRI